MQNTYIQSLNYVNIYFETKQVCESLARDCRAFFMFSAKRINGMLIIENHKSGFRLS
jgi:hypothetical protein